MKTLELSCKCLHSFKSKYERLAGETASSDHINQANRTDAVILRNWSNVMHITTRLRLDTLKHETAPSFWTYSNWRNWTLAFLFPSHEQTRLLCVALYNPTSRNVVTISSRRNGFEDFKKINSDVIYPTFITTSSVCEDYLTTALN
jgi:hypothetical protein